MRRRIVRRAQDEADRVARWWKENRPAAPALFADELERTLRLITDAPGAGPTWPGSGRPGTRRILMRETQFHVYYRVDAAADTVIVLAIWGARRGRDPRL